MNTQSRNNHSHIRLSVPMTKQKFDPRAWQQDGFRSLDESARWSNRSCGIACVRMLIKYYRHEAPTLAVLLSQAMEISAFSPNGWIHHKLAELLGCYNVSSQALGVTRSIETIVELLVEGHPVIASVTHQFPCDGRRGGHLVVVTGVGIAGEAPDVFYFNDPSSWGQCNDCVAVERFLYSFSGRIIAVG